MACNWVVSHYFRFGLGKLEFVIMKEGSCDIHESAEGFVSSAKQYNVVGEEESSHIDGVHVKPKLGGVELLGLI